MDKIEGLKLEGYTFNQNGKKLTLEQFLEKIESVGLEFGGSTEPVNEDGDLLVG